jgi:hypothetical protein
MIVITQYDVNQIQNTDELLKLKNQIKDSITTPMTWQRRIELYKIVKLINERIDMINK